MEDYITRDCLVCHQYVYHNRTVNRMRSLSGIVHTPLGIAVFQKFQINHAVVSDYTDGEICC